MMQHFRRYIIDDRNKTLGIAAAAGEAAPVAPHRNRRNGRRKWSHLSAPDYVIGARRRKAKGACRPPAAVAAVDAAAAPQRSR